MTKTLQERKAEARKAWREKDKAWYEAGKAYSKADKAWYEAGKAYCKAEEAMDAIIKEEGGK